jgi:histidine triad (HIT) family protein
MEDCVFCKIIKREIPSTIVYEDENIYAFNDINPGAPVHVLIVPKMHLTNLNDIDEANISYISDIHFAIKKIAEKLGILDRGYRVITNCGTEGGQTVMHLHYHLIGGMMLSNKVV